MARASRRARDERRFGRAERLADRIVAEPDLRRWAFPFAANRHDVAGQRDRFQPLIEHAIKSLMECPVLSVENVCEVYWDSPKDDWKYREDYPNSAPPFGTFFVESSHPGSMVFNNGRETSRMEWCPDQWGAMFWADECDGLDFEVWDADDFPPTSHPPVEMRAVRLDDARWEVRCILVGYREERLGILPAQAIFPIGARGEILANPLVLGAEMSKEDDKAEAASMLHSLLKPLLLSLSFMHCKNVVQVEHRPDREINRERRKAGMKPFLRYHTIDIEPMKRVLKSEGSIDAVGIKRALHICRGHFSTYSEEKPLFGKVAGTFWVPSHVRGSLAEGAVIADYRVGAPST
jgi:hypothetical protein